MIHQKRSHSRHRSEGGTSVARILIWIPLPISRGPIQFFLYQNSIWEMGCEHENPYFWFPTSHIPNLISCNAATRISFSLSYFLFLHQPNDNLNSSSFIVSDSYLSINSQIENKAPLNNLASNISTSYIKWETRNGKWERRSGKWEIRNLEVGYGKGLNWAPRSGKWEPNQNSRLWRFALCIIGLAIVWVV